jgi:hypothetical protein
VNRAAAGSSQPEVQQADDAEFVIGQTSEWIRNADTKTGLLFAGLAILLGVVSPHGRDLKALWHPGDSRPAAVWFLGVAAVFLATSFTMLMLVLLPRTSTSGSTRYAWPWLARATTSELDQMQTETRRAEAWRQARQLAGIAEFKYRYFTLAVLAAGLSVACLLIWSVLRP